jgi:tRNA (guanine37-N1)-methyltransferase
VIQFDILTLFPAMFTGPLTESILKRAQQAGILQVRLHDIRTYATDRHKSVDGYPFGGGAGMVMRPDVLFDALAAVLSPWEPERVEMNEPADETGDDRGTRPPVIYLTPDGEVFNQRLAEELAALPRIVLVCGHYEGVDERVRKCCFDREISIGDYVLTGGELAAAVLVDAITRLHPGVLAAGSTAEESHSDALLEYPHYTRPAVWHGHRIPEVLVSGHHARVAAWRREQRLIRTWQRRPDLLRTAHLTLQEQRMLEELGWDP